MLRASIESYIVQVPMSKLPKVSGKLNALGRFYVIVNCNEENLLAHLIISQFLLFFAICCALIRIFFSCTTIIIRYPLFSIHCSCIYSFSFVILINTPHLTLVHSIDNRREMGEYKLSFYVQYVLLYLFIGFLCAFGDLFLYNFSVFLLLNFLFYCFSNFLTTAASIQFYGNQIDSFFLFFFFFMLLSLII